MKKQSTYSLIINADAEEKNRSIFETAAYGCMIVGMAVAGWNFASAPVTLPGQSRAPKVQESIIATVPAEHSEPVVIASRG